ncbi:MAG TPA: PCRF domain-containing protein, partial [Patescibacteria group bacterium]|nr:PCRF domain-containing protein [Patescibacteria group bacterium]
MNDYLKKQIEKIDLKIAEAKKLSEDPDMADLAQEEIKKLEEEKVQLEKPAPDNNPQPVDSNRVILEIRAAAGGDEAGLFASDLLRMYTRFAQNQNWKVEELDRNEGG